MVKVAVDDRKLSVFVDPRNRGEWEECVILDDIPLPEGWAREAHIGLTATTGQLADNHDIIRCVPFHSCDSTDTLGSDTLYRAAWSRTLTRRWWSTRKSGGPSRCSNSPRRT